MMKNPIIVMNFSGVYEKENFYKNEEFQWIDCKYILGTNCYCDEIAESELRMLMNPYSPYGIHFIDSGNYHYVSKLWADKITEPFSLLLFDHHTDMQPPAFGNVLSCGSWVKDMMCNPYLNKIYLMGIDEKYIFSVLYQYKEKVVWFSEKDLANKKTLNWFKNAFIKEPLYISVDKDVLSAETVKTNWDQGKVSLDTLSSLLKTILNNQKVIGMDICGECTDILESERNSKLYQTHDKVNLFLLNEFLQTAHLYHIKKSSG
ncbi:arginase family protein [Anaerocolumna sedimenticola]|uniref:Arginase family protein n=1 Tax=Anaerocolumna sedimenticola TaxID=2696063 RepID=A0A6P1TSG5_9FIRM|nr:arginase family protein [Anaerocolumna sedimenticola]QHQ63202.1 arginase family protein [Anaerocolumna sedimenticola]